MTIAEQIDSLKTTLTPWCASESANLQVAGDASELVGLLASKPGAPRVVLQFVQEVPRGENDFTGRVERTYRAVVSRGRGLLLDRVTGLLGGPAGGKPLYQLAEEAREVLRRHVAETETEERPVNYLGLRPFELGGEVVMDAYQVEIMIVTQIPNSLDPEDDPTFPILDS